MTDKRQDILDAAMRVFASEGYERASIKKIARAAEIKSSALIYWYFSDKAALFNAVITELSPLRDLPLDADELFAQVADLPPAVLLRQIGLRVIEVRDHPTLAQLMRIYMGEAARSAEVAEVVSQFQKRMVGFLERYLTHQVTLGRLRPHDSVTAARMLVGSIVLYLLGQEVFPVMGATFPPGEAYLDGIIDVFLHGLETQQHDGHNSTGGGHSPA